MWNCLLDGFPSDYRGFPIRTDFRIGIMISLLLEDEEIDENTRYLKAFDLLYSEVVPDIDTAYNGLMWFLSCGKSELHTEFEYKDNDISNEKILDFNIDALDIWGGFWAMGVDLTKSKIHWFKFMSMLSNLRDCPITQKMSYRSMTLSGMSGETRKQYSKLKEKCKIRPTFTKDEYEKIVEERKKYIESEECTMSTFEKNYYRKLQEAQLW